LAIGIAGSSAFGTTREQRLRPGETMRINAYTLTYRGLTTEQTSNSTDRRALLSLGGRGSGTLRPAKTFYPVEQSTSNEVGIRHDWLRAEDLFVIADQIDPD